MSRKERLSSALTAAFSPDLLTLEDESANHQRPGVETHFRVVMVSDKFHETTRVERHRLVNALAAAEFKTGLHALSLHLHTPAEWEKRQNKAPLSPNCQHSKR